MFRFARCMIDEEDMDAYNLSSPFMIVGTLSNFDDVVIGGDGGGDR